MATFKYTCKDINQKTVEGVIEAESLNGAIASLSRKGLYPINIVNEKDNSNSKEALSHKKISAKNVAFFTRQLADLLSSKIALLRALEITEAQTTHPALKKIITELISLIKDGNSLSLALQQFPKTFSEFYINLVKSGEASGTLDTVLDDLAQTIEREEEIKAQVKSAIAYPLFIIIVGGITSFILISFVVPRIAQIFLEIDQPLPLITKMLIGISTFFNRFWWLILLLAATIILLINRQKKQSEGISFLDYLLLRIPVLAGIYRNNQVSEFCRTLSKMLSNGVHIITGLEITQQIMYSPLFKKEILRFTQGLKQGKRLGDLMNESTFLPLSTKNIIAIGEESGYLEKSLEKAGHIHEKEMNRTLKLATTLLEPVLILIIGIVIGFVVLAMLWPIFQINIFVR